MNGSLNEAYPEELPRLISTVMDIAVTVHSMARPMLRLNIQVSAIKVWMMVRFFHCQFGGPLLGYLWYLSLGNSVSAIVVFLT